MSIAQPTPSLESLGKFRIVRKLGVGAAGAVYLAEDTLLGRTVALKILTVANQSDRAALDRFILEARSASRLDHPNTVRVHEIDERDGWHYIAMEWLPGGSAQSAIEETGPIPWREATRWVADACRGLQAAHEAGMLHRDIKPANLLRTSDGGIKIGDFGLVKLLGPSTPMLTALGSPIGTPSFMSPEQCQGEQLDARSDVYSLGATYFALLTGKPPFESETSFGVMFAHCANPVPDPCQAVPEVPMACAGIIQKAMTKSPADRFSSAGEMLAALERIVGEQSRPADTVTSAADRTVELPPGSFPPRRRRRVFSRSALVAAGTFGILVAVAAGYWWRTPAKPPVVTAAPDPRVSAARTIPQSNEPPPSDILVPPNLVPIERKFKSVVLLGAHKGAITDLEYSATGKAVASASLTGNAIIWMIDQPDRKFRYRDYINPEPRQPIHAIAYNGERRRLVTPVGRDKMALWISTTGKTVDIVKHPHGTIRAIDFAPDGHTLVTGGDVGLHRWEVSDDDKFVDRGPILRDVPMVTSVSFSPVADWLAATAWNGGQWLCDWKRGEVPSGWRYSPTQYTSIVFNKCRLEWAVAARNSPITNFSFVDRIKPYRERLTFRWNPLCLDFLRGRRVLAIVGDLQGYVYFVDMDSGSVSRASTGLNKALTVVKCSPVDDRIAVGSITGDVAMVELEDGVLPPVYSKQETVLDLAALAIPNAQQIKQAMQPILGPFQQPKSPD